jgi:hypothetical protein
MFRKLVLGAMACLATSAAVAVAAPKDDLAAAAQKLADSPNYSFTITTANAGGGGFGGGTTTGKLEKDGYTTFSITMRDNSYDVVIKGDKAVVKTEDGWQLASDLAKPDPNGGGGGFNPNMMLAFRALGFKAPAAQATDLVSKIGDLTPADDALTTDLSPDTVKELGSFRPRNPDPNMPAPDITNPKGTAKFWIKDGVLTKMELHLQFTRSFNGNDMDVDRTTTTEIKDVGATTVDVPADAKAKLGS